MEFISILMYNKNIYYYLYYNSHLSVGVEILMNKISKIGLSILLLDFILIIALVLLKQRIPEFFGKYVFGGALIITFAGAIKDQRKNKLL